MHVPSRDRTGLRDGRLTSFRRSDPFLACRERTIFDAEFVTPEALTPGGSAPPTRRSYAVTYWSLAGNVYSTLDRLRLSSSKAGRLAEADLSKEGVW